MEIKETTYQSPAVEVIDVCAESIICASGNGEIGNGGISDFEEINF